MRYPLGHKRRTRTRILAASKRALRRRGLAAVGLASSMRGAGLTLGGFYAHFRSKLAFLEETLRVAMRESRERWFDSLETIDGAELEAAIVRRYLSREHLEDVDATCPIPALVSSLPSEDRRLRGTFREEIESIVAFLEARVRDDASESRRVRALGVLATCVGALALARAVDSEELATEILTAGRRWVVPKSRRTTKGEP
jgi:TetR/AcrR family transcriptional repressor of nem operon